MTGLTTAQFANTSKLSGFSFGTSPNASGCAAATAACWVIVDADGSLNNASGATGATRPILLSEYSTNITNTHQLQLMALNLSANYTLNSDLEFYSVAPSSDLWGPNGSGGFVPIGIITGFSPITFLPIGSGFTGTFNGQGNTIGNLVINNPTNNYVGLFTYVGTNGVIENVGVTGGSISGGGYDGALVGINVGHVTQSYATAPVTGSGTIEGGVGGLVGMNDGTVSQSYATGAVSGGIDSYVGGLVGNNYWGNVTQSYATGAVSGGSASAVGGLVGYNFGGISQSYATGGVTGANFIGGLVGFNATNGSITISYWDTQTSGQSSGAGSGPTSGMTGLTTSQFATASKFSGFSFGTSPNASSCASGIAGCWVIVDADGSLNNAGGAGGATRPFLLSEYSTNINNVHQLQLMELDLGAHYTLGNSIDLGPALALVNGNYPGMWGEAGFVPIGNNNSSFNGTFSGQPFTGNGGEIGIVLSNAISNLMISRPTNGSAGNYTGLFGYVGINGTIQNIDLESTNGTGNINVTGNTYVGALAGEMTAPSLLPSRPIQSPASVTSVAWSA